MPSIVWALFGLTAICGTTWGYPVGVATINTREEIHLTVSSHASSSSSEEDEAIVAELKTTAPADVAKASESNEDIAEETAEGVESQEEDGKPSGDETTEDSVSTLSSSPLPSHTDSIEEVEDEEVSES